MTARLRRLWLNIHLWLGVGLVVALIPLSVSGALLVWDQPLQRMLNADRYAVAKVEPQMSASDYAAAAQGAFGERAQVTSVRLPAEAGVPVTVVGQMAGAPGPGGRPRQLTAWLDPADARVTGVEEVAKSFFSVLHRLHGTLLIPNVGRKVVGWLGWAMTISCVTGLILWWPRAGFVKGLRWRRTPMVVDNLHHTIGFWICLPLAVLSLTGVYISFPQTARALFGQPAAQGPQRPRTPPAPLSETALTIDEAISTARVLVPEGEPRQVTFPTKGRDPSWRIDMAPPQGKPTTVLVSDASREVRPDRAGPGGRSADPTSRLMRKIHDGADTGPVWQTIIFLGGLAPAVLGVTGVWMWLARRSRKAALAAK